MLQAGNRNRRPIAAELLQMVACLLKAKRDTPAKMFEKAALRQPVRIENMADVVAVSECTSRTRAMS